MRRFGLRNTIVIPATALLAAAGFSSDNSGPVPFARSLDCPSGDCSLLRGAPQTTGMRSGFVRLKPSAAVGRHSTGSHEEALVILRGHGEALIEGKPRQPFTAPAFVYIPPDTFHNVTNTGPELLEYVYVVSPAKLP